LNNNFRSSNHKYFRNQRYDYYIEDDHVPFHQRGVPILHLIPPNFPSFWHTQNDNFESLHWESIQDIHYIFLKSLDSIFKF
jgi:glutaminyl-peptide cyclotransferase